MSRIASAYAGIVLALGLLVFSCGGMMAQTVSAPTAPDPVTRDLVTPDLSAPVQQPSVPAHRAELPSIHARLASGPITIDGKLDEPAWQQAEAMTMTQQSPRPGALTPYATVFRVLISHGAIIFGITCRDPKPSGIRVHSLTRDELQFGDDTISLLLDTFGDKRTAYYFQINAAGARLDGLVAGPGDYSTDWDGIWNARTARTADGWSAEIWIPAQTLSFGGGARHWGLELDRSIARDQMDLRWASPTLDADLFDMSRAGDLELMTPLNQGHGLEFAPYANGKMLRDFSPTDRNWLGAGGGEVTWRITPQLATILSVNTDFAETEVDSRQINVTPFPLYFPEKRAFFLEGANQYIFGLDINPQQTFIPFFSRNVGLLDGYNIPLEGGVKLNGHVGAWSLAFQDVQTRTTNVPQTVVQALALPSDRVEGTNLLASRIAYDIDKHLRIGTIVTHGDPEALFSNTLVGVDAAWHTSTFLKTRTLQFGGYAASTQGDLPRGSRDAWGLHFDYPNDLLACSAGEDHFGDGFVPLLGFLPRPATHQTMASCSYKPRPSPVGPFKAIRQATFTLGFSRYTDTGGNLESQSLILTPVQLIGNAGDFALISAEVHHETLTTPFAVTSGVTYPVGSYDFVRYGAEIDTSQQRALQFSNVTAIGGYYNGHLVRQYNELVWAALRGRISAGASADNYFGHTPQGNYAVRLWQFKGALSWSPDLSLSSFVQFDNVSNTLTSNTRLRWTFRPGDDFFVIWDRAWTKNLTHPGVNLDPDAESVTAKIRWTFRL